MYSMGLGLNWYQILNETCYIPKISKFSLEKMISMLTRLKMSSSACISDQNILQKGDPIELNFEVFKMHT